MKAIITIIMITFSFNAFSQTWNEIFSNDKVKIETTEVECNPNNKQYPFSYLIVKYTNKTNQTVQFSFEFELWYNGVFHPQVANDQGDEAVIKNITLNPNEVREGDCQTQSSMYKIFYKNNHPKMDQLLTEIKIKEHQTK